MFSIKVSPWLSVYQEGTGLSRQKKLYFASDMEDR